jgi:hypothetical protein
LTFLDNLANPLFPMTVHVSRINLVNQQGGDLQRVSKSRFQVPFCDHKEHREIRRIVADAFGTFFVIDPANLGQLRIRLSGRAPDNDLEERGDPRRSRIISGQAH